MLQSMVNQSALLSLQIKGVIVQFDTTTSGTYVALTYINLAYYFGDIGKQYSSGTIVLFAYRNFIEKWKYTPETRIKYN